MRARPTDCGYAEIFCPGCQATHLIPVDRAIWGDRVWGFNGNYERPTFTPSLLVHPHKECVEGPDGQPLKDAAGQLVTREFPRCHSFIKDGTIQFLNDCAHKLANQTVPLSDI